MGCLLKRIPPWIVRLSDINLPERKFKRVVFPEPDGPRMAVNVESWMRPCCFCKIVLFSFFTFATMLTS